MTEMTCREAGRLGGQKVLRERGVQHYRAIGQRGHRTQAAALTPEQRRARSRKGGEATRDKLGAAHYAAIGKKGGEALKAWGGREYYERIGRLGAVARAAKRAAGG